MLKGILEGLIKPSINTDMDMSENSRDTYNIEIEKVDVKIGNLIGNLVITDKEIAKELTNALLQIQQCSEKVKEQEK
jgi:hypothetical protein